VPSKAVVLAAGKGTRLDPLTDLKPKPLLHVMGRPFLSYVIENLIKTGYKDIAIIVGYMKEQVEEFVKDGGFKVTLIEQHEQQGTGHAVSLAEQFVGKDDFVLVMGDNLCSVEDLKQLDKKDEFCYLLGYEHEQPENYGVIFKEGEFLKKILEKPEEKVGKQINTAFYKLTPEIFEALKQIRRSSRGELEFTDALSLLAKSKKVKVLELNDFWLDFGYPWDMLDVNRFFLEKTEEYRKGDVSPKAELIGKVIVEQGAVIKSGCHIQGPVFIGKNCDIGPNCYIRPFTSLSENVHVGAAAEIKNSIVMSGSKIPHHNYVGDSIIGSNCNLGSGTKVANLRHDNKNVFIMVKEKRIDSGRRKLGVIMGDNVRTGINSSIMPGVRIGSNAMLGPGVVLYHDLEKDKSAYVKQKIDVR